MSSDDSIFHLYYHVAHTSAPSLQVVSIASLSITVNWTNIQCSDRNGRIEGYNLSVCSFFKKKFDECAHYITKNTSMEINKLDPITNYVIRINAFTIENNKTLNGPMSKQLRIKTKVIDG